MWNFIFLFIYLFIYFLRQILKALDLKVWKLFLKMVGVISWTAEPIQGMIVTHLASFF